MVLVSGAEKAGDRSCFFCAFFAMGEKSGHISSRKQMGWN